jgi:hypothetical protein
MHTPNTANTGSSLGLLKMLRQESDLLVDLKGINISILVLSLYFITYQEKNQRKDRNTKNLYV